VRGEAAGDAEADHAAVAVPDGTVGDRLQFAAGRAANHLHPRCGGDLRLKSQTHESDDQPTVRFDGSNIGDPERVVRFSYQSINESSPGKIQLGCH
jgi:hypothetical protein